MSPMVLYQTKCKVCGIIHESLLESQARNRRDLHIEATRHPTWVHKKLITAVVVP